VQTIAIILGIATGALTVLFAMVVRGTGRVIQSERKLRIAAEDALRPTAAERDRALAFADREHRRANDQGKVIGDVIRERETWQRIYHQSALGAGAAQEWLMRDLGHVLAVANEYRKAEGKPPVRLDPAIEMLVHEFQASHPAPTVERAADVLAGPAPVAQLGPQKDSSAG